jgi:hypothetical protein
VLTVEYSLHRQQKKNYVKFLEQDVIRLREMISAMQSEAVAFHHENAAIKDALAQRGVQASPGRLPNPDFPRTTSALEAAALQYNQQPLEQSLEWARHSSPSSSISVTFDERMDASCLHVSPASDFTSQHTFPVNPPPSSTIDTTPALPKLPDPPSFFADPPPHFRNRGGNVVETMPKQLDTSFEGINFILA